MHHRRCRLAVDLSLEGMTSLVRMALDNFANLQTAVANWLARPGDSNITANVGDMITLFEAEARRRLKTRFNETRTTLATVAGTATVALPSDFGEMREITVAVGNADKVLVYAPPEQMDAAYPSEVTDESILYTIEGTNLRLKPIPGQVYSLSVLYMQGIVALSNRAHKLAPDQPPRRLPVRCAGGGGSLYRRGRADRALDPAPRRQLRQHPDR
jgi:hypothetical protein